MAKIQLPATDFMVGMIKCPTPALVRADPVKLADKYGISRSWVADAIAYELMMRGVQDGERQKAA